MVQGHNSAHSLIESGEGSVYQDVSGLEPGRTYVVSAWVTAPAGTTATAYIGTYDPAVPSATFSTPITANSGWQLVTHPVTVKGTMIRIHLFRGSGSGEVYWDEVRLYYEK